MKKVLIVIDSLFFLLSVVFYIVSQSMPDYKFIPLEIGNFVMAIISVSSYFVLNRRSNAQAHSLLTGVYSANLIKMFGCIAGVLIYILMMRPHIHKPTVFIFFGMYVVYTIIETFFAVQQGDQKGK